MESDPKDSAALQASLATALASIQKQSGSASVEQLLSQLDRMVAKGDWVLSVARNLEPNWYAWLSRPWSCVRLAGIRRHLLRHDEGLATDLQLDAVARVLAHVEFGAAVDAAHYRLLRVAAIEHGSARVRRLVASPFVWWGVTHDVSRWRGVMPLRWLWTMGRPEVGVLHYMRPHPITRVLLLVPAALGGALLLLGTVGLASFFSGTYSGAWADMVSAAIQGCVLLWTSWWFGVHGPRCVDELDRLLGSYDV